MGLWRQKKRFLNYLCKVRDINYICYANFSCVVHFFQDNGGVRSEFCLHEDWNVQFCYDKFPPFCTFLKRTGNCKYAGEKEFSTETHPGCANSCYQEVKQCKPFMIRGKLICNPLILNFKIIKTNLFNSNC